MISVTYTATSAHYDKIRVIATRIYNDRMRIPRWKIMAESLLIDYLPPIFIFAPLILAFITPQSVGPWHLVYFMVVSFIWGYYIGWRRFGKHIYPLMNIFMEDVREPQETTFRLMDTGVEILASGSITTRPWCQYSDVRLTEDFVLLERGKLMEFIPVETFAHPDEAAAFIKFACTHIKERSADT